MKDGPAASGIERGWLSLLPSSNTTPSSSSSSHPIFDPFSPDGQTTPTPPPAIEYQQDPYNFLPPFPEADVQTPSSPFKSLPHPHTTSHNAFPQYLVPRQDPSLTKVVDQQAQAPPRQLTARIGRSTTQALHGDKDIHVPPPFLWATTLRATVHSLDDLNALGISIIQGEVQCKRCEARYEIGFDLMTQFEKISEYIRRNKSEMHDRAPLEWKDPKFPDCNKCKQTDCLKPVISPKKRSINWLFLLLGKMLGCCTLDQLKYFCKHTGNHRTGAKDRVLYLTYLSLCKQLRPDPLFERC